MTSMGEAHGVQCMHQETPCCVQSKALKHIVEETKVLSTMETSSEYVCVDLSSTEMDNALKTTAKVSGVPKSNYATHSIRIGGATALLNDRVDSLSINLVGRWMSRCYEEYLVEAAAATTGMSARMV